MAGDAGVIGQQGGLRAAQCNAGTTWAIGGFHRYNDDLRDKGFPADCGGQIRANIKHELPNG